MFRPKHKRSRRPTTSVTLAEHRKAWKDCKQCNLCEFRDNVVLYRGIKPPCEILFIGEAPGESEDALGQPFIGPAGKQLDLLIKTTFEDLDPIPTYGMTNMVACIPFRPGEEIRQPNATQITACSSRLVEMIAIAQPKLIVLLGKISAKYIDRINDLSIPMCRLGHPSWIMRLAKDDESTFRLEHSRFTVTLLAAWEAL